MLFLSLRNLHATSLINAISIISRQPIDRNHTSFRYPNRTHHEQQPSNHRGKQKSPYRKSTTSRKKRVDHPYCLSRHTCHRFVFNACTVLPSSHSHREQSPMTGNTECFISAANRETNRSQPTLGGDSVNIHSPEMRACPYWLVSAKTTAYWYLYLFSSQRL